MGTKCIAEGRDGRPAFRRSSVDQNGAPFYSEFVHDDHARGSDRHTEYTSRSPVDELIASVGGGLKRILARRDVPDDEVAEAYREALRRRVRTEKAGLAGHTTSFLGVNAVLVAIWGITGASFPWFLFPLMGWGIGYASHRAAVTAREAEYREVVTAASPNRGQLRLHRDVWKQRRSWWTHLASNGMTVALLGTINAVTGGFPWALIPSGFLLVGIFAHRARVQGRIDELTEELARSGFNPESGGADVFGDHRRRGRLGRSRSAPSGERRDDADPFRRAKAMKAEIVLAAKRFPETATILGSDIESTLDRYVEQIGKLANAERDVASLRASIPREKLERDKAELTAKRDATTHERLSAEYERSIEQIEKRLHSAEELAAEHEILRLKINAAIETLNQLRIDVARAGSAQPAELQSTPADLDALSSELSHYIDDLRASWDEVS